MDYYWNNLWHEKKLDIPKTMQSVNSWLGHSSHCNSYKLQNKILKSCDFLYTRLTDEIIENSILELMNNNINLE